MIFPVKQKTFRLATLLATLALFLISTTPVLTADDKKMTVEQLVASHLAAIGSDEARAAAKTRFATGSVKFISRIGNVGQLDGKGGIASTNPKVRYSMRFPAPDFPSEEMVFDGEKSATSFLPEGKRSNLAQFLDQHNVPLKEGLICGTLSTAWALFRLEELKPKLEYKGLGKVNGRQLHKVQYRQRKGSPDLKVMLYFDPQTFRHVRSEYQFQIGARMGLGPNDSNAVQESYYTLSEDFDDFRAVDALTLPHSYKLQLSISTSTGSRLYDYHLTVEQLSHKEVFNEQTFKLN